MSVEMPVEIITTEIVNAARRTRKPKTVVEVSIVDEILANVRENKFAEEACETLKRIFGREFCVEKGIEPSVNDPEPVVEPKAKKPRAKKATTSEEKKPRAKKTETVITMGEVTEPVVEPVVNTPILVTEPVVVENLGDGFSEHWSDELVEEELSDIEEEEE
jgi:hypothetical protein